MKELPQSLSGVGRGGAGEGGLGLVGLLSELKIAMKNGLLLCLVKTGLGIQQPVMDGCASTISEKHPVHINYV